MATWLWRWEQSATIHGSLCGIPAKSRKLSAPWQRVDPHLGVISGGSLIASKPRQDGRARGGHPEHFGGQF